MSKTRQAFDAPRKSLFLFDPMEIQIPGIDFHVDTDHPLYDSRIHKPLEEDIIETMMELGVLQPITVRKDGVDGPPIVVDGRRRVLHAREANRRLAEQGAAHRIRVPANPPEKGANSRFLKLMIVTNEHREEDSPINRSKKLQRFMGMGYTEQEAASAFKTSIATVKQYLKLLDLHPIVQKALESGKIPTAIGYQLADKTQDNQLLALEKILTKAPRKGRKRPTVRDAEEAMGITHAKRPTNKVLSEIVNKGEGRLSADFLLGIEFARGCVSPEEVQGLAELLAELGKS